MIEKHWASWRPEAEMPLLTSRFSTRKKRLVWTLWLLHAKLSWHCYLLWSRMFVKSPTDIMQRAQGLTFLASGFQLHAPLPLCLWGLWLRSPRVWNGEGTPFSSGYWLVKFLRLEGSQHLEHWWGFPVSWVASSFSGKPFSPVWHWSPGCAHIIMCFKLALETNMCTSPKPLQI